MKMHGIDNIIVTSDEPWCEIWHTQLHYAFQLSKRTNVIFLGPPNPWKFSNLFKYRQNTFVVKENLLVVTYHNLFPAGLGKASLWINDHINTWLLKKNIIGSTKNKRGIVWHFDSRRSLYVFRNKPDWRQLFHVIDPIAGCNLDNELAKLAELIVVTSPKFLDHYHALNANVLQVAQGVDLDFYNEQPEINASLVKDSEDSILLLGTITDQINFILLKKIATRFPSKLILIGPDKTQSENSKLQFEDLIETPGVKWLGPMPPSDFRHHLRVCRVGIIAYDNSVNSKNDFRSPLKVISYLACKKNIISNIDCEIPSLINNSIYIVSEDNDYFNLISRCYNNELYFNQSLVTKYLESIDYSNLLDSIFRKLGEQLPAVR